MKSYLLPVYLVIFLKRGKVSDLIVSLLFVTADLGYLHISLHTENKVCNVPLPGQNCGENGCLEKQQCQGEL